MTDGAVRVWLRLEGLVALMVALQLLDCCRFFAMRCDWMRARCRHLLDSVRQLQPCRSACFSLQGRVNALGARRLLQATTPQLSIVAFTADTDPELRRATYEAGCFEIRLKDAGSDRSVTRDSGGR